MGNDIWVDKNLLRSHAFRSLSKWSIIIYLDFLRKRQVQKIKRNGRAPEWIIKNNGEIIYPYSEAEHRGISRRNFRNSIDELISKGFLDIRHQGSGGRKGDVTKYFIDDRWKDYGTDKFRPPKNPRTKDSRKGRGWEQIWSDPEKRKRLLEKRKSKRS